MSTYADLSTTALDRLITEAGRGWPHALAWMDALADTTVPGVVDFPVRAKPE
ncbi:hypothetical protein ABZU76_38470 [Amycolatopsis sp. NPDC005232]|uniref:hypothetical protein n=1 Tax=Amycolatopsis sp. NPDC005232 TaxID=3157027 RepID=UPI0033BB3AFC